MIAILAALEYAMSAFKRRCTPAEAQQMVRDGIISSHYSFTQASEKELDAVCNGCGAMGSWLRPPKTMWGTCVEASCQVHDWDFHIGVSEADRLAGDVQMLNNYYRLINLDKHKWYKPTRLQRVRAKIYYRIVRHFGKKSFYKNKLGGK